MSLPTTATTDQAAPVQTMRPSGGRRSLDKAFVIFCVIVASVSVIILAVMMMAILVQGLPYLSWRFLTSIPDTNPAKAGIYPALGGTIWVCGACALFTLPIGVATAIYLEEFKPRHPIMRFFHGVVQLNINNLAGVPSVVYGIIGLTAFVAMFGLSRRVEVPASTNAVENSPASDFPTESVQAPLFEFGARYFDQFGAADSNRMRNVNIRVPHQFSPSVELTEGMEGETFNGIQPIQIIGPWEPAPKDASRRNATIRRGSEAKRVEIEGQYFDQFTSFVGTTLRVPVNNAKSPTTVISPPLKAIKEDGSECYVKILSSSQVPTVEFPLDARGKRIEADGQHFDAFTTKDNQVLRVPVTDPHAPQTELADGKSINALASNGVAANIVGKKNPRPGANKARFDEILRAAPSPGRIDRESWYCFRLPFGRSVLAGGLTLMLVILPIIIIAGQESLRAVPDSLREGALGMGATPWQVVRTVTLPAAVPGIMTGSILAMSRAIGEAAPILIICGIVFISYSPGNLMDDFTVMPLQIYNWAALPDAEFQKVAASGIIVLLAVLLTFNGIAVLIRQKMQKPIT